MGICNGVLLPEDYLVNWDKICNIATASGLRMQCNTAEMGKGNKHNINVHLSLLFNSMIHHCFVPSEFCMDIIHPLLKN